MNVSATLIRNLRLLLEGKPLAWSALNAQIRGTLVEEDLLNIRTQGSRKTITAVSVEALRQFLEKNFEEFRGFNWNGEDVLPATRAELAAVSGNSKMKVIRSCPGFMVNSYSPIPARLGAEEVVVAPVDGSVLFIADWEHFSIPSDVLVVGIENMENFLKIRQQKQLFPADRRLLFVSRYPQNGDLVRWLKSIGNTYLHFGDFDMAGMHIFETEFLPHLRNRALFLIPNDIEMRLQAGSAERYNSQYGKYKHYVPDDERLLPLYRLIQKYHRCYDQEGYIEG